MAAPSNLTHNPLVNQVVKGLVGIWKPTSSHFHFTAELKRGVRAMPLVEHFPGFTGKHLNHMREVGKPRSTVKLRKFSLEAVKTLCT